MLNSTRAAKIFSIAILTAGLSACHTPGSPFLTPSDLTFPDQTQPLTADQVRLILDRMVGPLVHAPKAGSNRWTMPMIVAGVKIPSDPMPYCEAGITKLKTDASPRVARADIVMDLAPCLKRMIDSGRSDDSRKLLAAIQPSFVGSDKIAVLHSCSKRSLADTASWQGEQFFVGDFGGTLCLNDSSSKIFLQSQGSVEWQLGQDLLKTEWTRSMSVGELPCSANVKGDTYKMKLCQYVMLERNNGGKHPEALPPLAIRLVGKELYGKMGQPYYLSGYFEIRVNNWRGALQFRADKPPLLTLSSGKERLGGTIASDLLVANSPLAPAPTAARPGPSTSTPIPNNVEVVGPPPGTFQVLHFSGPNWTSALTSIAPLRAGKVVTSSQRNAPPGLKQLACDRNSRICYGATANDIGVVDLKTAVMRPLGGSRNDPSSTIPGAPIAMTFDYVGRRLIALVSGPTPRLVAYTAEPTPGVPRKAWDEITRFSLPGVRAITHLQQSDAIVVAIESQGGNSIARLMRLNPRGAVLSDMRLTYEIPLPPGITGAIQLLDGGFYVYALVTRQLDGPPSAPGSSGLHLENELYRIDPMSGTVSLVKPAV